jgi:hypothetical protein
MHERFQRKEQAAGFVVRKSFIRQDMHPISMADWPPNRSNGVLVPPEWKKHSSLLTYASRSKLWNGRSGSKQLKKMTIQL